MFAQARPTPGKLEEEFSRPVESIMRCEDFKSNFARRLSNRFISKSPISPLKQESPLKPLFDKANAENVPENVPERIERSPQLSKNSNTEHNGEAVEPPDKQSKNSDIRSTEVSALNMEVDTLRWQLAQTEANRQMHIALLTQIVSFLNRVKEHIELQSESPVKKSTLSASLLARSFNTADLPRTRSVVHVNKNHEYTLNNPKKISTRKLSRFIDVADYKECAEIWSQSRLSLAPETEKNQKITEEMSRLITLANTVLSTKLPDLSCTCSNEKLNKTSFLNLIESIEKKEIIKSNAPAAGKPKEDIINGRMKNESIKEDTFDEKTNNFMVTKEKSFTDLIVAPSKLTCGLDNVFSEFKTLEKEHNAVFTNNNYTDLSTNKPRKESVDKRNEYNSSNFVEDESGFSSMNSFQEIGIPIISIIPPSPCKEIGFLEDIPDILDESEKWKTDTMELEKQTMKVFWV